jgi:nicotinate-nucleotide adenylyltransferase
MLKHYHDFMQPSAPRGSRIAFFGGSFDPPHNGHLAVAHAALQALHLDRVLFAPVAVQPLKPLGSSAGFEDRLAMTQRAICNEPAFELSLIDAPDPANPRKAPNYTLDTLSRLRMELPPDSTLFCLMGADSFLSLRRWHHGEAIPFVAPLIVAARPGQKMEDLGAALPSSLKILGPTSPAPHAGKIPMREYRIRNADGREAPFYVLPGLQIDISASQIRQEIRRHGLEPPRLLPAAVAQYIAQMRLYR